MGKMLFCAIILIAGICNISAGEIPRLIAKDISYDAPNRSASVNLWLDTTTLRYRIVSLNDSILVGDSLVLQIELFRDVGVTVKLKKTPSKRGDLWVANNMFDYRGNEINLTITKRKGIVSGIIYYLGQQFEIKWIGTKAYAIIEVDPARLIPDAPARKVNGGGK